jgi:uncharacterized protein (DUF1697 family)
MTTYIALLRGINVGKAKRIAMADLRALLEGLGHEDVSTLLMSGNVVFRSSARGAAKLAAGIERAIADQLDMDVRVLVRTAAQVRKVVDDVPFTKEAKQDPARLGIAFVEGKIDRKALQPILDADWMPERFAVGEGATYLWQPNGITGSPLGEALLKLKARDGTFQTVRNLATVQKVLDRAESLS